MSRLIWAAAFLLAPGSALAHHAMGGETPATFTQGLLSGLGHPVIGLDHLAFLIAVGLVAAGVARGRLLPAAFVAAMVGGVAVHLAAVDLPLVELAVAGSALLLGVVLALQARLSAAAAAAVLAVAGLFHGYAYGEAIVGAEPTPVAAYLLGLVAVQYAIALGACEAARRLQASGRAASASRLAGGAVAAVGAAFLALNVAG